jgi:hypothetical protein
MSELPFASEPALPLCPICGKPMRLKDYGEPLAKNLGLVYDEGAPARYAIVCCGYVLRMEDEAERREVVRLLRLYHQSPGQK